MRREGLLGERGRGPSFTTPDVSKGPGGDRTSLVQSPPKGCVAVVTVNWNGWRDTLACLDALRATRDASWRLFIVDNASTDDSLSHFVDLGDEVTCLPSPTNGGWTGGNNVGVAHALRAGYQQILLLNNDACVEPGTLAAFLAGALRAPKAILGGVLCDETGVEIQSGFRLHPPTGLPRWTPTPTMTAVDDGLLAASMVCGAALFARADVFDAIGPFDDAFYLYNDEADWCVRGAKAGHPSLVVADARLRHSRYGSTGGDDSPLVAYFRTRNGLLFAERHATLVQRLRAAKNFAARAFAAGDRTARARRRGLLDYLLRRFGDCPEVIRRLQDDWRSAGA